MAALSLSVLAPWLAALGKLRIHPVAADLNDSPYSGVWLNWTLPTDASRADTTRYLEAMELLVLLAWADQDVWLEAAETLRSGSNYFMSSHWISRVINARAPVYVLGHNIAIYDARIRFEYVSTQGIDTDRVSSAYVGVRATLEKAIEGCDARVLPEVPFQSRLFPRRPVGALPVIAALAETPIRLDESMEREREFSRCLRILRSYVRKVRKDTYSLFSVPDEVIQFTAEVWTCGVAVIDFPQMESSLAPRDYALRAKWLRSLLGVQGHGTVWRVSISQPITPVMTPPLFSALALSSSVREVAYEYEKADDDFPASARFAVQWMAYALFSVHATNQITRIHLRCLELQDAHVEAMRELLEAEDPLPVLYPDFADSIHEYRELRVSASSLRLDHLTLQIDQERVSADVTLVDVRVLGRTTGSWYVLVPGWGAAWVEDEHAIISQVAYCPKLGVRSVEDLVLSAFSLRNKLATRALLSLIGGGTRSLRVEKFTLLVGSVCGVTLEACPCLEQLVLRGAGPRGLDWISQVRNEGSCKSLRHIDITMPIFIHRGFRELGALFNALADPSHTLAHQLETLLVDVPTMAEGYIATDLTVLHLALRMLQNNTRLERLKLHLPLTSQDMNAVESLQQGFQDQHGVLIAAALAPLGNREKAAFLSVIWGRNSETSSAMHLLDRRVVATVFEFAPERRRRHVDVAMPQ